MTVDWILFQNIYRTSPHYHMAYPSFTMWGIAPYPIGDALYPNSYRTSTSARPCATQHTPALPQKSELYRDHYRLIQQIHSNTIIEYNSAASWRKNLKDSLQCASSIMSKKIHAISTSIENVKYRITSSLKHSYNTVILTESKSYPSKSYRLLKCTVTSWATS